MWIASVSPPVDQEAERRVTSVEELLAGKPYRLVDRFGGGAMGSVYVVEHEFLQSRFALKVLHAVHLQNPELIERVKVEALAIAQLHHPNVVEIVMFWVAHGVPCLVLELLEGWTVARELHRRQRLPPNEGIGLACQALSALEAAHDIGILHRDIKPENLFLHHLPGRGTVLKVLDFGLAKILPDVSPVLPVPTEVRTRTGQVVGTPRYLSPEAARGERVGPPADLYALGFVLYVMLTGRGPFAADNTEPDPPSKYVSLSGYAGIDDVVLRALARSPADRYADAAEFRAALERFIPARANRPRF
jgi:serine/threonine-protein kinase